MQIAKNNSDRAVNDWSERVMEVLSTQGVAVGCFHYGMLRMKAQKKVAQNGT